MVYPNNLTAQYTASFIKNLHNNINMETITIPKKEYDRLKQLEQLDFDLIRQFASSLEDLKSGRFKRLA